MRIAIFYKGLITKEYIAIVEDTFTKNTDSGHTRSTVSETRIIQKLGLTRDLMAEKNMTRAEVIAWAREYTAELRNEKKKRIQEEKQIQKELRKQELAQNLPVREESARDILNCGYLYLYPPLAGLRFDLICRKLRPLNNLDYELFDIVRHLIVSLVIRPHVNPLAGRLSHAYVERPAFEKKVVRSIYNDIACAADQFRTELYLNLKEQLPHQTRTLYFGCVDVGFENNGMNLGMYLDEFGFPVGYICIANRFDMTPFIRPQAAMIARTLALDPDIPVIDLRDESNTDPDHRSHMTQALAFMHDSFQITHMHSNGKNHMRAELVIGYIACMILRLIQMDIKDMCTIDQLVSTLRSMKMSTRGPRSRLRPAFTQNEIMDVLADTYGYRFDDDIEPKDMRQRIKAASRVYH